MRQCLICRNIKEEFTNEHMFPEVIGGGFILTGVCKACNTALGKNIDAPFVSHRVVGVYRKLFDLRRRDSKGKGKRSIPNPFSGRFEDGNGNEIYIQFNEGKPMAYHVPKDEAPVYGENGWVGITHLPADKFTTDEEIIQRYAKKHKLDPAGVKLLSVERTSNPAVTISLPLDNGPFILGALKIAYEFAGVMVPSYLEDPLAAAYREVLLSGIISDAMGNAFDEKEALQRQMMQYFEANKQLQVFHHAAVLKTIPGVGLVCGVRIFNWVYAIHLSESEKYVSSDVLIVNHALRRIWSLNIKLEFDGMAFEIDNKNPSKAHKRILAALKKGDFRNFVTPTKKFPIYDWRGTLIHKDVRELVNENGISSEYYNHRAKMIYYPVASPPNRFFIRSKKERALFPLKSMELRYRLLY